MSLKKINHSIQIIFYILLTKKLYLIKTPQNYISLVEYLNLNKVINDKSKIVVGYTSSDSARQIEKLHSSEIGLSNKIVFLKDGLNETFFSIILKIFKIIKFNKRKCIVGDKKYFLFKILYQNSLEVIFLDDGLNLLVFKENFQVKDYKLFSYFNLNNKRVIKNNFNFLKTKVKNNLISDNEIWLLGTPASTFSILDNNVYSSLIKKFAEKYKDKKIFFFPHRDEKFNEANLSKNIIVQSKLVEPIEIYASKQKTMPFLVAGFYTTALHILSIILDKKKIAFMNINFNTNLIDSNKLKERYNLTNLKQQYNLVKIILEENSIQNFF